MFIRFPLSLRNVEDLLYERGIDITHETVRFFGGAGSGRQAKSIRKRRTQNGNYSNWTWHLDEVFVKINGELHYLWRAVDHEGEVLEAFVTKRRDRKAALKFLRKAMKRYGCPEAIVTDRLPSYKSALRELGIVRRQETARWRNNRAENSHQPLRRREKVMGKFRRSKSLHKFAAVQSFVHNHFNLERHLVNRTDFKENRSTPWPNGVSSRPDLGSNFDFRDRSVFV